jgi:uncharacterized protein VirK/YbjX
LPLAIPRAQLPHDKVQAARGAAPKGWHESLSQGLKRDMADKGLGGSVDMVLRLLKVWMHLPAHLSWLKVIQGPTTRKLLAVYPRLAYRYSLPYLAAQFDWDQRLEMMKAHYGFLNKVHSPAFFEQVLSRGVTLQEWSTEGRRFRLALQGPCLVSRHREGELCIAFQMDGALLYQLSFSVIPTSVIDLAEDQARGASPLALYVGHVQGKSGQLANMREAASLCHDVAQQDILMSALAGLAKAWGINRVLGVRDSANLSLDHISQSAATFEYAPFWSRYHAVVTPEGHHAMSLPFAEKPITDIAAKRRKRTLTKRQFKQALTDAVAQSLPR